MHSTWDKASFKAAFRVIVSLLENKSMHYWLSSAFVRPSCQCCVLHHFWLYQCQIKSKRCRIYNQCRKKLGRAWRNTFNVVVSGRYTRRLLVFTQTLTCNATCLILRVSGSRQTRQIGPRLRRTDLARSTWGAHPQRRKLACWRQIHSIGYRPTDLILSNLSWIHTHLTFNESSEDKWIAQGPQVKRDAPRARNGYKDVKGWVARLDKYTQALRRRNTSRNTTDASIKTILHRQKYSEGWCAPICQIVC